MNGECHKLDDADFVQQFSSLDIVCLLESHHAPSASFAVPGFDIIHAARPKHRKAWSHSGGMLILMADSIRPLISVERLHHDCSHLTVALGTDALEENKAHLIFAYIPPTARAEDLPRTCRISRQISAIL